MATKRDRPWWDTRVSAGTAKFLAWLSFALAAVGLLNIAASVGDWVRFGFAVAQALSGLVLAVMHVATVRARRREEQQEPAADRGQR